MKKPCQMIFLALSFAWGGVFSGAFSFGDWLFAQAEAASICFQVKPGRFYAAVVTRVVDGDTVRVRFLGDSSDLPIRMVSTDTPETHYRGRSQGYWGELAANTLRELLPAGTLVRIEIDALPCDRYGRLLGYVWKDFVNINRRMLEAGLAVNYCVYPNIRYCRSWVFVVARNFFEKRGIFSDPDLLLPYEWRRLVDGRAPDQFVGDQLSYTVYWPGNQERVLVPRRIFFYQEEDIHPPYHLSEECVDHPSCARVPSGNLTDPAWGGWHSSHAASVLAQSWSAETLSFPANLSALLE